MLEQQQHALLGDIDAPARTYLASVTKLHGKHTAHNAHSLSDRLLHSSQATANAASLTSIRQKQHQQHSVHSRKSVAELGKRTAVTAVTVSSNGKATKKNFITKKTKSNRKREEEDVSDGIKGADELAQETLRTALSQRVAVCDVARPFDFVLVFGRGLRF